MNIRKERVFTFYSRKKDDTFNFFNMLSLEGYRVLTVILDDEIAASNKDLIELEIFNGAIIHLESGIHAITNKLTIKEHSIFSTSFYYYTSQISLSLIKKFLNNRIDVFYAYETNYFDLKWQNEKSLEVYKANELETDKLKITRDIFNKSIVDVSFNYGRSVNYKSLKIVAGENILIRDFFFSLLNLTKSIQPLHSVELNGFYQLFSFEKDSILEIREKQFRFLVELQVI